MIRVKHLQSKETMFLSEIELFYYLLGLCQAGRNPVLHISPYSSEDIGDSPVVFEYYCLIEFRN